VTGRSYGLPSEAEWEKGVQGTNGRIDRPGNHWNAMRGNSSETGLEKTASVHACPEGANSYGMLDMPGTTWEWTCSLWGKGQDNPAFKYPYNREDGRENLDASAALYRVARGGVFDNLRRNVQSTSLDKYLPLERGWSLGSRVVVRPPL
jgi:formylglycine-generating enzyme required for sulfatase activity